MVSRETAGIQVTEDGRLLRRNVSRETARGRPENVILQNNPMH
jgi:hypothetical protein